MHPTATVRILDLHLVTHQEDVCTPVFTAALFTIASVMKWKLILHSWLCIVSVFRGYILCSRSSPNPPRSHH